MADIEKKSFLRRILDTLNRPVGELVDRGEDYSRFHYLLEGLDRKSEEYSDALRVAELCEEAVSIIAQRIALIERQREVNESLTELEGFSRLTDEDSQKLKGMLDHFASLTRDRNLLRNQLSGFDRSLAYMRSIEGDAHAALDEIKEAEERQRIFRQDLAYLESENSELEYDRNNYAAGLKFIHSFTIALIFIFGGAVLILGYLFFFRRQNVIFPAIVVVSMVLIVAALLYAFNRRIKFELELNVKKQRRAAEMINKKTTVYAYYTSFLNYEYNKYRVRNSEMLKDTISEYNLYKHLNARLDSIRNIMYQTEKEIQDFLRERKLDDIVTTIAGFAESVDVSNKREHYNQLVGQRRQLEGRLRKLDGEHEQVWNKLIAYQKAENKSGVLIDTIIKTCIEETSRVITNAAKQEKVRESDREARAKNRVDRR